MKDFHQSAIAGVIAGAIIATLFISVFVTPPVTYTKVVPHSVNGMPALTALAMFHNGGFVKYRKVFGGDSTIAWTTPNCGDMAEYYSKTEEVEYKCVTFTAASQ